ncbi:hypothetical protein B566_EDAN009346 [Ephemera danica]|nr:hypothetical protein B566_EDAN009346 [Ephemera danica]
MSYVGGVVQSKVMVVTNNNNISDGDNSVIMASLQPVPIVLHSCVRQTPPSALASGSSADKKRKRRLQARSLRFQLPPEHQQGDQNELGIKQEQPDADNSDEACVPAALCRSMGSMQKVPSLSDLSDPESSLGEYHYLS